jgi:glucan phosphoethanolaminetransferase (alkaline phosphatase superfamily)
MNDLNGKSKLRTRGFAAFVLSAASPAAHASGSPIVIYVIAAKTIMLLCIVIWAVAVKRPYRKKLHAFASIGTGFLLLGALSAAPNYRQYEVLIEATSLLVLALVFASVSCVLRQRQ